MSSKGSNIPHQLKEACHLVPRPSKPTIPLKQLRPTEKPKVAIPRHRASVAARTPGRVSRACESCRIRKTKCSGDGPVCKQCHELHVNCVYPLPFRERTKRQISSLSHRLQECEDLLREVENFVPESISQRIRALLNKGQDPSTEMGLGEQSMHDAGSVSSLSVGSVEGAEGQEAEQHTKHNEARQSLDSFGTNNMNYSNNKDFGAGIAKRVQTW